MKENKQVPVIGKIYSTRDGNVRRKVIAYSECGKFIEADVTYPSTGKTVIKSYWASARQFEKEIEQ